MKTLFLSSLILFCGVIAYNGKKHKKMEEKFKKDFWEREASANSTRKKPLDNLPYITIPFETLPTALLTEDGHMQEILETLRCLSEVKIVNLTGFTNTDLKLEYGTANITCLSEYDANYTLLVRTLQSWAEILCENHFFSQAQTVLEFAVSTRTDISRSYYLLADIYHETGQDAKIESLIQAVCEIRSPMKSVIARTLQESGPYSGLLHCG